MKTSNNYGLKLMEGTDNVKRQDFVDNFTKIDSTMKTIADSGFPLVNATGNNAYIGSNTDIKSLTKGTKFTLFVGADANGNCTLNLNSYGVKSIKDSFGNIVTNLKKDIPYNICYNGTDFILQGKGGGGNVQPSEVLNGKTFTNDKGPGVGTMANNGAINGTLNAGQSKAIPKGYTEGGTITANSLASQTQATAQAGHMLSGQTAWVNGNKIIGNISRCDNIGSPDGNGFDSLIGGNAANQYVGRLDFRNLPRQYIEGNMTIHIKDLLPQYIVSGVRVGGPNGIPGSATIESMGGRRFASGVITPQKLNTSVYIPGINLPFTPKVITYIGTAILQLTYNTTRIGMVRAVYFKDLGALMYIPVGAIYEGGNSDGSNGCRYLPIDITNGFSMYTSNANGVWGQQNPSVTWSAWA